jgi:hypothetical protein
MKIAGDLSNPADAVRFTFCRNSDISSIGPFRKKIKHRIHYNISNQEIDQFFVFKLLIFPLALILRKASTCFLIFVLLKNTTRQFNSLT